MKRFAEAVSAFRAGDLSDSDLYRTIMAWPTWHVMAEEVGGGSTRLGVMVDHNGFRVLDLFSAPEALDVFCEREKEARPTNLLQMAGFQLFSTLADEAVQRINIDLHSVHATQFFEHQIPLLRAWAEVVATELALAVPDRIPNPFAALRRFEGYNVLIRIEGANRDFVMAPDPERDRMMAAVFTAEDTLEEFIGVIGASVDGELAMERMDGETLFAALAAMPLDGIVFNPLSHLPPIALQAAVIARVLES